MRISAAALLILGMVRVLGTGVSASPLAAGEAARIDAIVSDTMARSHVPGASIAIARDGNIIYAHGYGLRDVENRAAVDASTVFEIGSITKQFTAASIMLLVQVGKIRLDAPVATYLPNVPFGDKITVRNLLTHTSGLAEFLGLPNVTALVDRPVQPQTIIESIAKLPLDFPPGTKWEYSNTNYVVLGMLVEKQSGESYPDFVRTRLLEPLHLTQTQYRDTYLTAGDVALPYEARLGSPQRVTSLINLDWAYAAGALWSNAPDLVRWEEALYSGRVVDATSLAAMTTPAVLADGKSTQYGFGLLSTSIAGQREIWHNGGLPGYSSIDAYFPDQHLEIAVLGNTMGFEPSTIVRSVLATLVPSVAATIAVTTNATPAPGADPAMTALAIALVTQVQSGNLDRTLFDARTSSALTPALVGSVTSQLAPLGKPKAITYLRTASSGPYHSYAYRVVWDAVSLDESFALDGNGKIVSWLFRPADDTTPAPAASPSAAATASPSASASP